MMHRDVGTVLHDAARMGLSRSDLETLLSDVQQQLEAAGVSEQALASEINRRNENRYTPLHTAIFARSAFF